MAHTRLIISAVRTHRSNPGCDMERGPPQAYVQRPEWSDHSVDALQGTLVRGDDQQQKQECGQAHEVE